MATPGVISDGNQKISRRKKGVASRCIAVRSTLANGEATIAAKRKSICANLTAKNDVRFSNRRMGGNGIIPFFLVKVSLIGFIKMIDLVNEPKRF